MLPCISRPSVPGERRRSPIRCRSVPRECTAISLRLPTNISRPSPSHAIFGLNTDLAERGRWFANLLVASVSLPRLQLCPNVLTVPHHAKSFRYQDGRYLWVWPPPLLLDTSSSLSPSCISARAPPGAQFRTMLVPLFLLPCRNFFPRVRPPSALDGRSKLIPTNPLNQWPSRCHCVGQ
jgi:hypothetical protein